MVTHYASFGQVSAHLVWVSLQWRLKHVKIWQEFSYDSGFIFSVIDRIIKDGGDKSNQIKLTVLNSAAFDKICDAVILTVPVNGHGNKMQLKIHTTI